MRLLNNSFFSTRCTISYHMKMPCRFRESGIPVKRNQTLLHGTAQICVPNFLISLPNVIYTQDNS